MHQEDRESNSATGLLYGWCPRDREEAHRRRDQHDKPPWTRHCGNETHATIQGGRYSARKKNDINREAGEEPEQEAHD